MTLLDPNETPEERRARQDAFLRRNSKYPECDLCDREIKSGPVTNIGDSIEVILACASCLDKTIHLPRNTPKEKTDDHH